LTDDGLKTVTEALRTVYAHNEGQLIRLEELCLRGNDITARSLAELGRVVALATIDLRDLDLSNNKITIETREDAVAWQAFLRDFAQCCVLRRIDLSGNVLGPKAFEILGKVYIREPAASELSSRRMPKKASLSSAVSPEPKTPSAVPGERAKRISVASDPPESFAADDERGKPDGGEDSSRGRCSVISNGMCKLMAARQTRRCVRGQTPLEPPQAQVHRLPISPQRACSPSRISCCRKQA
jgi:hypothetical protein